MTSFDPAKGIQNNHAARRIAQRDRRHIARRSEQGEEEKRYLKMDYSADNYLYAADALLRL